MVYSIIIGKLLRKTVDLAKYYGAKCEADSDCNGIFLPPSKGNQHVPLTKLIFHLQIKFVTLLFREMKYP